MIFYGNKHTDGESFFKTDKVLLSSSAMNMYELKNNIIGGNVEGMVQELLGEWKNNRDVIEAIDKVSSYCKKNDLSPLVLLLFYYAHFASLENVNM